MVQDAQNMLISRPKYLYSHVGRQVNMVIIINKCLFFFFFFSFKGMQVAGILGLYNKGETE